MPLPATATPLPTMPGLWQYLAVFFENSQAKNETKNTYPNNYLSQKMLLFGFTVYGINSIKCSWGAAFYKRGGGALFRA